MVALRANSFLNILAGIRNRFVGFTPVETDLVGYEVLLDWIERNRIHTLDGDIVEIGSFLGGGTIKLASFFQRFGKNVYAVDIFDPSFDPTKNVEGSAMSTLYSKILRGRSQEEVFREITKECSNIVVIKGDSKKVMLPCEHICFSFIDGCHDPSYVRSDFYLVWDKTVSGGVVAFHDYGGDLPQTTKAIDELIEKERNNIDKISYIEEKTVILINKK
jgi:hypothetical protein